jgi:hypothetical protein
MRREASAIDVKRFAVVAQALQRRYGWQAGSSGSLGRRLRREDDDRSPRSATADPT